MLAQTQESTTRYFVLWVAPDGEVKRGYIDALDRETAELSAAMHGEVTGMTESGWTHTVGTVRR